MAMESVADIFPVRNIFNDPVFFAKLLYLQSTQILCRCRIDRIEVSILFLKFIDLFIDML